MKFAQVYKAALEKDEYPPEWLESAISYKKLKKCIKRVQEELQSLGLDRATLETLWQHAGTSAPGQLDRMLRYGFEGGDQTSFVPQLTIAIDPRDGSPMDAWLSKDTRRVLRRLAKARAEQGATDVAASIDARVQTTSRPIMITADRRESEVSVNSFSFSDASPVYEESEFLETIEIPLTSDSEFFQILRRELDDLDKLQDREQRQIQTEITELGKDLQLVKAAQNKKSKSEVQAWRKVFELYNDAQPFLSSHEQDAGVRKAKMAEKHLQQFTTALMAQNKNGLRLGKDAKVALDRFVQINVQLLRLVKFQEINQIALMKIMKKFDKRTALHAQQSIAQNLASGSSLGKNLAKAMYFTISSEILTIIPSLDDYLCPVCFSISYKPIRLRCNHIFCIRCMVVMQRAEKAECPLCRKEVVMDASSENIDKDLMKFLKQNFKDEVRQKQQANEIAAGVDRWGEGYEGTHRCAVM